MGKSRDQGGVTGWVPYHPAIARALAPHMPRHEQSLAPIAAMFLTLCYQLRGKSTIAGGAWIEKTTANWMDALGVSKRTVETVIRFMCRDDKSGQTQGLGLIRRRRCGYRTSAQYLVDDLRTGAFWLTHGPQPALRGDDVVAEIGPPADKDDDSLVSHPVDSLVSHPVDSQVSQPVDSLVSQPHKNTDKTTDKTTSTVPAESASDQNTRTDAAGITALLQLYGFKDTLVEASIAKRLAGRPDAELVAYLICEISLIEQEKRAGGRSPIANVVGWMCRGLRQFDLDVPALTVADVTRQIQSARDAADAYPAGPRRPVQHDEQADEFRQLRQAAFERIAGQQGATPVATAADDEEAKAAQALADIERRRLRRQVREAG